MSEQLRVELSGDASKLKSALSEAQKALQGFENDAKSFQDALEKNAIKSSLLGRQIKALSESFKSGKISSATYEKSLAKLEKQEQDLTNQGKSLRSSLKDTQSKMRVLSGNSGLGGVQKATANVTPTLLEFNRVIQDAPYGIQGVANNITQLTTNFGYLKQSTGSTKGALKALVAGFTGPAGILFAVSAVTSLLVAYGNQLNDSRSEAEKTAEATKKAAEALENYADSLEQVSRARLRGEQSAQKELLTLSQLRDAAEDTSRSTIDRKKAVQELRKLYPDYFKDLKDEEILTGGLKGVYDQLTDSILKRARATAASNQIVKNSEKQLIIESQLAALNNKISKEKDLIRRRQEKGANSLDTTVGLQGASIKRTATQANEQDKLNDLLEEQNNLLGQQQNLELSNIDLSQLIDTEGGIDLSDVKLKEDKAIKLPVAADLDVRVDRLGDTISRALESEDLAGLVDPIYEITDEVQLALENLNTSASALIQGSISNTFGELGASIGNALATGGNVIQSIGSTLIGSLGSFLSDMGKLLIEYGTLAVFKGKLDIAIATLPGPGTIAAGLAAIGVGIALSAAGAALGSAATGGNTGSSSSIGGSTRTSSFIGSGGGFDGGRVVFEISGQKLVGVLDRTRNRNLAIGG